MKHSPNIKKPIFLLGSGRSGTTLIQRLLNSFPNTIIWGEHDGFLSQIAETYFLLKNSPSMHRFSYANQPEFSTQDDLFEEFKKPDVWQAWINGFNPETLPTIFQDIVESFFFSATDNSEISIWGFKEIRYGKNDKTIEFLSEIYPESSFIFITRDSLNTIESKLMTFFQGKSKYPRTKRLLQLPLIISLSRIWRSQNKKLLSFHKENPKQFELYQYEEILDDHQLMSTLLNKYELTFGEEQEAVFNMKQGRGTKLDDHSSIHYRWKKMGIIPAFIIELITGNTCKELGYNRPHSLKPATTISKLLF